METQVLPGGGESKKALHLPPLPQAKGKGTLPAVRTMWRSNLLKKKNNGKKEKGPPCHRREGACKPGTRPGGKRHYSKLEKNEGGVAPVRSKKTPRPNSQKKRPPPETRKGKGRCKKKGIV